MPDLCGERIDVAPSPDSQYSTRCALPKGHIGPHRTPSEVGRMLDQPHTAERRVDWRREQDRRHAADHARAEGFAATIDGMNTVIEGQRHAVDKLSAETDQLRDDLERTTGYLRRTARERDDARGKLAEHDRTAGQTIARQAEQIKSLQQQLGDATGKLARVLDATDSNDRQAREHAVANNAARAIVRMLVACDDDMEDWCIRMEHGLKTLTWVLDA
ncbi:hypothetical protein [Mycobacterium sp.]|uniref:hypothetical protein n=1 Tax=Mycobacterium sp. TaxID=1785 RepID=UPI00262E899E|nr:hypothetical protein [Mycobacterium sp.]